MLYIVLKSSNVFNKYVIFTIYLLNILWIMITVFWEEKFQDPKGVIRHRKSKKDSQYNGQKKKDKRTNSDLRNTT